MKYIKFIFLSFLLSIFIPVQAQDENNIGDEMGYNESDFSESGYDDYPNSDIQEQEEIPPVPEEIPTEWTFPDDEAYSEEY